MKRLLILTVFVFGLFLLPTLFKSTPVSQAATCTTGQEACGNYNTSPNGVYPYYTGYAKRNTCVNGSWSGTIDCSASGATCALTKANTTTCVKACTSISSTYKCSSSCASANIRPAGTNGYYCSTGGTCCSVTTPTPTPTPTSAPKILTCPPNGGQQYDMSSCNTNYCCSGSVPICSSTQCAAATPTPGPAVWYGGDNGTYNNYLHIHPVPANTGDTCTTVDAQHMCSSVLAITANGEASAAGTCPYVSGNQVTLNGTKYSLGMSYSNCITIAASNVPTPTPGGTTCGTSGTPCTAPNTCVSGACVPPTSATGKSKAQYCTGGVCKDTPDGGNCVIFSTFSWPKPADAATNPNYQVKYNIDTDSKTYGPYSTSTNTLTTPFKVSLPNYPQCTSTDNGNQANTGYACGFLQGKQVTWYVNYTKTGTTTLGKITGNAFFAATCSTQTTCTDPNLPNNPYYACDATNNTCTQYPACGKSTCTGTNDTTTCKPTLPLCDDPCTAWPACTGTANTCGNNGTQSCVLTTHQGSTNCTTQTVNQSCAYDRCSDTPGNVCQGEQCVNPNNPSPSNSPTSQPTNSANPSASPTTPPVSCTLPNLNPHFECQQNTCVAVNTCAQNSGGCTQAGGSCGVPAGDTSLSFTIGLDAIGSTGDQPNPYDSSSSNQNPLRPIRNLTVEVLDANYNPVLNKSGIIAYNLNSGKFLGTIDIGKTLTSGNYIVKVISDGYLKRLIPGAQNIIAGQANNMPEVSLIVGDITQQNTLSILDYNVLMSCSIYSADNGGACNQAPSYKKLSDLEDNGPINQFDYNLFVREYSVQNGQ